MTKASDDKTWPVKASDHRGAIKEALSVGNGAMRDAQLNKALSLCRNISNNA